MKPLVLVPACVRDSGDLPYHHVLEKYLVALADGSDVNPLILPSLGGERTGGAELDGLLDLADGLFLTGSPSNVEPHHYGGEASVPGTRHDPARDATMIPLLRRAVGRGTPIFAMCRGIQELNVALGGTLHQRVHELPGRMDHLGDVTLPPEVRYGPRHAVRFTPGGLLERLAGRAEAMVSSFHRQAVDRPATGVTIEATATDGTIEAFTLDNAPYFGLAVQWHPEYRHDENALSRAMFSAFGDAVRAFRAARRGQKEFIAAAAR